MHIYPVRQSITTQRRQGMECFQFWWFQGNYIFQKLVLKTVKKKNQNQNSPTPNNKAPTTQKKKIPTQQQNQPNNKPQLKEHLTNINLLRITSIYKYSHFSRSLLYTANSRMLNYFSALSSCFLQKELLCLLSVPSPTCADPQQMHTQLPPPAGSSFTREGLLAAQPHKLKAKSSEPKSTPSPTGTPREPGQVTAAALHNSHGVTQQRNNTRLAYTHQLSWGALGNRNNSLPSEQNYSVKDKTIYFLNLKLFKIPYFTSNNMENTKGWMFQIHVLVSACRYLNYPVT